LVIPGSYNKRSKRARFVSIPKDFHAIILWTENAMTFDPSQFGNVITGAAIWSAAMVAVFWISLVFWVFRDIRTRTGNPLARFFSLLLALFFFLPGVVIYLILRPRTTLEEEYQKTLEEEALLQSVEEAPACPGCGRRIKDDWVLCPSCHTKLRKVCEHCKRLMDLPWNICPYCGTPTVAARQEELNLESEYHLDKAMVGLDFHDEPPSSLMNDSMPDDEKSA
jgi:RNA polymerase subunit RPABC4/transcription elongation factor Spt4